MTSFNHRVTDKYQDDYARHMKTHMPVIDRNTGACGYIVVRSKKNRKKEGELNQPRADFPELKAGVVLLFKFFDLSNIQLRHNIPSATPD
jgi:hypothetical protein